MNNQVKISDLTTEVGNTNIFKYDCVSKFGQYIKITKSCNSVKDYSFLFYNIRKG